MDLHQEWLEFHHLRFIGDFQEARNCQASQNTNDHDDCQFNKRESSMMIHKVDL